MWMFQGRIAGFTLLYLLSGGCSKEAPSSSQPTADEKPRFNTPAAVDWPPLLAEHLSKLFPSSQGWGYAQHAGVVGYVHVLTAADHWVYVTSGASTLESPHEFVMRVSHSSDVKKPDAWRDAPMWPVQVLCELAEVEKRTRRELGHMARLRKMVISESQGKHRHFLIQKPDGVLKPIIAEDETLSFVRVVPLTDEELALVEAPGPASSFLADWFDADPLMKIPRRGTH